MGEFRTLSLLYDHIVKRSFYIYKEYNVICPIIQKRKILSLEIIVLL